jgi:hypothetical protein
MVAREAVAIVSLLAFSPALAEDLDAEAARRFIVGKLFAFTCADGMRGAARIYDDGSVIGTIQFHDSAQPRPIWLPSETLKLTGEAVKVSLTRRISASLEVRRTNFEAKKSVVSPPARLLIMMAMEVASRSRAISV